MPNRLPRRFQFGLRTLLIVVSLLSVWLGWITHQAQQQRRVVAFIHKIGGSVEYESDPVCDDVGAPIRGDWLRQLLGPDIWYDVVGVEIGPPGTFSADLDVPLGIRRVRLEELLTHLETLPRLRRLRLDWARITDDDLARISRLQNLEYLSLLFGGAITDVGLAHVESLRHLQHLRMDYTAVTQNGIDRLQQALPNCRIEW